MDGLLGKKLSHSYSPIIHKAFGNPEYRLFETSNLAAFFASAAFSAINVTLPYKEKVIPYLTQIDDIAKRTRAVNLIIRTSTALIGMNTDYYGLNALLQHYHISLLNKKVLIIGNGGAARTASALAVDEGCQSVTKIVRRRREIGDIKFSEIDKVTDCDIIINATPVGMFPNNESQLPLLLKKFTRLEAVIDVVYNPLTTTLMTSAKDQNIPAYNGLYMLISQARKSQELASGKQLSDDFINRVYLDLQKKACNLVLVGLPLAGKSFIARALAKRYHKTFVDTDALIETASEMPITQIFQTNGEPYFRALETKTIESIYRLGNQVIATGGGMIENQEIMHKLKQNGIVIFLDKNPQEIKKLKIVNRPLIHTPDDIIKLAVKRRPLYEKYADIIINPDCSLDDVIAEIEAKLNEYFNN
ncbi:MAG: shikimate kinase [Candidatus Izemoplasmatales bacterium]|nr:shikimate kinase [Candidatus Izemoplasmatales bacterium]